jgi:NADH:ubiquinone oxidoreductase subunit K
MNLTPENMALLGVLSLFAIGLYGMLIVRNVIKMVAVLQILVKGAILAMVLAGKISGYIQVGQSLAIAVIVADTIVAVMGLALAVQARHRFGTLDTREMTTLKG